jgi:hypothetical protein
MRKRIAASMIGSVLLLLLGSLSSAQAWYEPSVQRWVNRDPAEEAGGINLYRFAANRPSDRFDMDGRQAGTAVGAWGGTCICPGLGTAVGAAVGTVVSALTGYCIAKAITEHERQCEKEWADARDTCARELAKPSPSRGITGGYKDIENCARGLVSEGCGGNPIDWGKKRPKSPIHRGEL